MWSLKFPGVTPMISKLLLGTVVKIKPNKT